MSADQKIDWLHGQPREAIEPYLKWRTAVEQADKGDTESLIELLRSNLVLGPDARGLVADLLARHNLRRKRGRQAVPAYESTINEAVLNDAHKHYKYFRRKGHTVERACQNALREIGYPDNSKAHKWLMNRVNSQRGSTQRMKKRRG